MRKWIFIFSALLLALLGCNSADNDTSENTTCLGFNGPNISVFVRDNVNRSQYIENANVSIEMRSRDDSVIATGQYIAEEDSNLQSSTNAYFSTLTINASNFDIEINISADGYLSETKTIENFSVVTSCGAENSITENIYLTAIDNDELTSCDGFMSPDINVFVRDAVDNDLLIEDAIVSIVLTGSANETTENAQFIPYDVNESNLQTNAYYSLLSMNESSFDIELIVSANGYHSSVTKIDNFTVNTSCMADNSLLREVYLCPQGTDCT